jgi:hypothetical protein
LIGCWMTHLRGNFEPENPIMTAPWWHLALVLVICGGAGVVPTHAQPASPRLGLGLNGMLSTPDGLGFGFRGRASAPVNADLSLAVDVGFTGFVLQGRAGATYVFDPQLSAIVTLPPRGGRAPYVIGGLGAYVPFADARTSVSGPTIHLGGGWVHLLRETTLFYEVNPAVIIGERSIHLAVPARVGVIF